MEPRKRLEVVFEELGAEPMLLRRGVAPPALPLALARPKKRAQDDDAWLYDLAPEARAILEAARVPAQRWPVAPRLAGAVAIPVAATFN